MAQLYSLMPRPEGLFRGVDLVSRAAFGLIYDRWKLSEKKHREDPESWIDEDGVYCVFDQGQLAELLGVTRPTINKALQRLEEFELLVICRPGLGKPSRYHIPYTVDAYFFDYTGWQLGIHNEPPGEEEDHYPCKDSLHAV